MPLARPNKTTGRVVLGPRASGNHYVRIVALADGSGRVEMYDKAARAWIDALETCSFSDVWRATAISAMTHASLLDVEGESRPSRASFSPPIRKSRI